MGTAIKEEQKTESASLVAPKLSVEIPEKWKRQAAELAAIFEHCEKSFASM